MTVHIQNSQLVSHSLGQSCRSCGAPVTSTFADLGMSPLCESFIAPQDIDKMEAFYPLHALVCDECHLVQLNEYVTPEHIFSEYAYFSSYSTSWVEHARQYCEMIRARLDLGPDSLAVEVASNDGYLLQHLGRAGIPILGIEPAANVARVAIDKGVPTRVAFFGSPLARMLVAEGRSADVIIGNNVLAQVPDLNDFVEGLSILLKPDGVITLEFPHLLRLIEEAQFDTIYHEHFSYFSLTTLSILAGRHGLKVADVEELPTHGGSLRVYLVHKASLQPQHEAVAHLLAREERAGVKTPDLYARFAENVRATKRNLLKFLIDAKNDNKTICGYGAPGKGNTLLNYCGIGPDFLEFTVDRNPYKHGRFTPGQRIPIRPVPALDEARPDYILILPWNLKYEILREVRHVASWGGRFVIPIPEVTIIDPAEFD